MIYRTAYDPEMSAEGALDPLGLYSIADLLANRILPGIRERHSHPRFLSFIAVGLLFMDRVEQELPSDAWQVDFWEAFEWNVVSAVVASSKGAISGLPGQEKAKDAMRRGVPLNHDRYLKQSSVFGFHGVYKLLTRTIKIETDNGFGISGESLAHIWMKAEEIDGFLPGSQGACVKERERFVKVLVESLKEGEVREKWSSSLFPFLAEHFNHLTFKEPEADYVSRLLRDDGTGSRAEVLDFLRSEPAQKLMKSFKAERSEKQFYEMLLQKSSPALKKIIAAILAYESFARLMYDAFSDILFEFTLRTRAVGMNELVALQCLRQISGKAVEAYRRVDDALDRLGVSEISRRFNEQFDLFSAKYELEEWIHRLLTHHIENQKRKPPSGKRPWFDIDDNGKYWGRHDYYRDEGGLHEDEFVHFYRLRTLQSFLVDLKEIK